MKKVKAGVRLLVIILLLILAAFGIGITGNFLTNKERYMNNEVKTEEADKKEEEEKPDEKSIN
jgi:hypothetical protein